jgi:tRNA nucleotidyltransferase (CCA-adding enzyme)
LKLYFVGGCVRDKLLGIESKDLDIVLVPEKDVNLEFKQAIDIFISQGYELIFKSQFYTAKFKKGDIILDLTISRKEKYDYNGALPKVEISNSIYEDLKRRDFTINAMAMDFENNIIDIFNSIEHLRKRILIPINSLLDDPTRILRGIRYAKRLNLRYSQKFLSQINSARRYLKNVSFSRIKRELELISIEKNRIFMWQDILKFNLFPNLSFNNFVFEFEKIIPYSKESWILFYITFLKYPIELKHITRLEISILDMLKGKFKKIKNEIYEIAKYILKRKGLL